MKGVSIYEEQARWASLHVDDLSGDRGGGADDLAFGGPCSADALDGGAEERK